MKMNLIGVLCSLLFLSSCVSSPDVSVPGQSTNIREWEGELKEYMSAPDTLYKSEGTEGPSLKDIAEGDITLDEIQTLAQKRNPGISAALENWKQAVHRASVVSGMPDPMFQMGVMQEEIVTRNGPIEANFGLTQKFPWFGKLNTREREALAGAGGRAARYRQKKWTVRSQVASAFYEYFYINESIAINREIYNLLEQLVASVRTRYENGQVPQQDLLKVQIEVERIQNNIQDFQDMEEATRARLNGLMNRSPEAPLGNPVIDDQDLPELESDQLIQYAVDHRPEISQAVFKLVQAREQIELAELNYYPDVTLGAMYSIVDETPLMGAPDSGQDAYGFSLMFNLPIYKAKRDAKLRAAKSAKRSSRRQISELVNSTRTRIKHHMARLRKESREIELLEDSILPKAEQALASSKSGYESGKIDVLNLLDSERNLLQFRLNRARAISDGLTTLKQIEEVIGGNIQNVLK